MRTVPRSLNLGIRMPDEVPILMYHRIAPLTRGLRRQYGDAINMIIVDPRAFESQIRWLARAGYSSVTLDDLLDHRAGIRDLPSRPVVITFDDGYQDLVEYALPVLRSVGFTAHFFLVAGQVGSNGAWDRESYHWEFPLFDWDTARVIDAEGFEIGAHTMTHPWLAQIDHESRRREITESRQVIEEQLGREIRHFAYPFGSYDESVRSIVEEAGFRSACSVRYGLSPADDDPLALRRINVFGNDSMLDFRFRLHGQPAIWERWGQLSGRVKRLLPTGRR